MKPSRGVALGWVLAMVAILLLVGADIIHGIDLKKNETPVASPVATVSQPDEQFKDSERVNQLEQEINNLRDFVTAPNLGAAGTEVPTIIALFETSLASQITSSVTSMTLTSATDKAGNTLASSTYPFIIDEGSSNEEMVLADCTGTACTNMIRGINPLTGTTSVASLQKAHRRGASVKITDGPQLMILSRMANGIGNYPNLLNYKSGTACSGTSLNTQICDKAYIDGVAVSGASNANETTKGIIELATQIESASSTQLGSTGAGLVLQARYSTSSPYTTGIWNVVTQNDGKIIPNFIATSSSYFYNWGALHTFNNNVTFLSNVFASSTIMTTGTTTVATTTVSNGARMFNNNIANNFTAGETITGAGVPVPVSYATTSSGRVYIADGDVASTTNFIGFAVNNSVVAGTSYVQTDGIVYGFTGLTAGTRYYVSDTAGTLQANTPGTLEIYVGVAISTTAILIDKGPTASWQVVGTSCTSIPIYARFALVNIVGSNGSRNLTCEATLSRFSKTSGSCAINGDGVASVSISATWGGNAITVGGNGTSVSCTTYR